MSSPQTTRNPARNCASTSRPSGLHGGGDRGLRCLLLRLGLDSLDREEGPDVRSLPGSQRPRHQPGNIPAAQIFLLEAISSPAFVRVS
eukprot:6198851-Pleurochrysis_carterae.AAC.5